GDAAVRTRRVGGGRLVQLVRGDRRVERGDGPLVGDPLTGEPGAVLVRQRGEDVAGAVLVEVERVAISRGRLERLHRGDVVRDGDAVLVLGVLVVRGVVVAVDVVVPGAGTLGVGDLAVGVGVADQRAVARVSGARVQLVDLGTRDRVALLVRDRRGDG